MSIGLKGSGEGEWDVYQDSEGAWRWRHIAEDGRIIAESSGGFRSREGCVDDLNRTKQGSHIAKFLRRVVVFFTFIGVLLLAKTSLEYDVIVSVFTKEFGIGDNVFYDFLLFTGLAASVVVGLSLWSLRTRHRFGLGVGNAGLDSLSRDLNAHLDSATRNFKYEAKKIVQDETEKVTKSLSGKIEELVKEQINVESIGYLKNILGEDLLKQNEEWLWRSDMLEGVADNYRQSMIRIDGLAKGMLRTAYAFIVIGIALAIFGIVISVFKFYLVLFGSDAYYQAGKLNWDSIVNLSAISIPTIVLCEGLALIMFRYYSRSLELARYYANEVTVLYSRISAAMITLQRGSLADIQELAKRIGREERNFVLKKGESTLETTSNGSEDEILNRMMSVLPEALKAARGQSASASGRARRANGKAKAKPSPAGEEPISV